MNFKVVTNAQNQVVACGPNTVHFNPVIPSGGKLHLSDTPVDLFKPKLARIVAIERSQPVTQRMLREVIIALADKNSVAYQKAKAADDAIAAIRNQP